MLQKKTNMETKQRRTKDTNKCCMRSKEKWLVKDSGERFKAIKKNDAAKLNYKPE